MQKRVGSREPAAVYGALLLLPAPWAGLLIVGQAYGARMKDFRRLPQPLMLNTGSIPQLATPDVDEMVLLGSGPRQGGIAKLTLLLADLTACHRQRAGSARILCGAGGY
jgi:hypothetical protein